MMEHRWDARIHAPMNVIVHTDGGISFRGQMHNISRGGVCLEMEQAGDVDKKVVQVEFNQKGFSTSIPSLVLRRTKKTAALMFITHPPELQPFLNHLSWFGDSDS